MNVKFLNPFIEAAIEVLKSEINMTMTRGDLALEKSAYITSDITVIIALVGSINGNVFYSMDYGSATTVASRILGEKDLSQCRVSRGLQRTIKRRRLDGYQNLGT